ncbi:MAG: hypothetical protein ACE5IQ_05390 [Candidatus Methylomirabilales bacterium]
MKRTVALLVILAALAGPALAWAGEEVWSDADSANTQASHYFRSPETSTTQSEESVEVSDPNTIVEPEQDDGDSA